MEIPKQSYFYDSVGAREQVPPETSSNAPLEANSLRKQVDELTQENNFLKAKNQQLENDFKMVSEAYLAMEAQLEDVLDAKAKAEERNDQNHLATIAFARENRKSNARICFLEEKLDAQPRLAKENERLRKELMEVKEMLRTKQMLIDQQTYVLEGGEAIMEDAEL